jgi:glycerol uptake facilitator-like aquaporin
MGFGWIAYGFGLAFFFPILTLGYISAHINPAMCLGLLAVGKITGKEFIALALSEFAGMFVGAVFVYVRPRALPYFMRH